MSTSVAAGDEMTILFQWLHATLLAKRVFAPCGVIRELILTSKCLHLLEVVGIEI